ncbi:MAG: hypothetical protein C0421_05855 [Hyphomonas sp.]|uniref:ParB/RepB/Spo0J family partition protein n=1 Tax=Hyphomonas sp. TaxID=87 RepID=UPI0025C14312|nr:ParB/RepB/Spo0J family partition protein [Hyphomonas sp.]MBA4338351.1 hypothetical protein [Hyphomonas sp.]
MAKASKKTPAPKKPAAAPKAIVAPPRAKAEAAQKRAKRAMAKPEAIAASPRLTAEVITIPHNLIAPSPLNPRKSVREGYIEELAESLLAKGQLQNISVRLMPSPLRTSKGKSKLPPITEQYQIIYGEQRWTALKLLIDRGDLPADTPVLARILPVDDAEHIELAILENQAREDVHPLEQAEAYARLAEIRRAQTGDETAATRVIAERTGQTMRNVQFYLQCATNLSPKVKEAWRSGLVRSRKIAIELARWPHDIQDDFAEELEDTTDPAELRRWIESDAPPVSAAKFDLEAYAAAGGVIVPGEDGQPDRLANKGLAAKLQREWAEAEVKRLKDKFGCGLPTVEVNYSYALTDGWQKAPKGTDMKLCAVRWFCDARRLETGFLAPAFSPAAAAKAEAKAKGGSEAEGVQPLSRRNWIAGAAARTTAVRDAVANNLNYALAAALMAILPKDGWFTPLCAIRTDAPTGDAAETAKLAGGIKVPAILKGLPGFTEEGEIDGGDDGMVETAMTSLLALTPAELAGVFSQAVAALCVDGYATARPGAKGEVLTILGEPAPEALHGLCTAEWLKGYTMPQLHGIARDSAAAAEMEAASVPLAANKAFLVSTLPGYVPAKYVPPEARVLNAHQAEQAVASMLARGAA